MKSKIQLYTLLKVKSDYGLSGIEKFLLWIVKDVSDNEYMGALIDLRDSKHIKEINDGNALLYRTRYLTISGYEYLEILKKLYLKDLWISNRWKLIFGILGILISSLLQSILF